jgi:hypothetical protein
VCSKFAAFVDVYGAAMIPVEVTPPSSESSAKSEEAQPKDSPQEDPDTARGDAFKRMFPDVPRKTPDRSKKPSG